MIYDSKEDSDTAINFFKEDWPQNMGKNEGAMIIEQCDQCPDIADFTVDSLSSESCASVTNTDGRKSDFNFHLTEGQSRRRLITGCDSICSEIFDYLYVGGFEIARSMKILEEHGITRIINCSASVVDNYFIDDPKMTYLSLHMVDGREDDISWFLGDVLHFIMDAKNANEKVLLHCQRGVSRSCSFAIAFCMWTTGKSWIDSFNFVKSKRSCCAPNTAFTCNLIEINECIRSDFKEQNIILFRLASHLIPSDSNTVVLKMCRDKVTRKFVQPKTSILDPRGVYVIKIKDKEKINEVGFEENDSNLTSLYVWKGNQVSEEIFTKGKKTAEKLLGIFTNANKVEVVKMGEEPVGFFENVLQDGTFSREKNYSECYDDLFSGYILTVDVDCDTDGSTVSKNSPNDDHSVTVRFGSPNRSKNSCSYFPSSDSCDGRLTRLSSMQNSHASESDDDVDDIDDMFYDYSNSSDDSDFESDGSRTPDSQKSTPRKFSCDSHDSYFSDKSGLGGKDINAFLFNTVVPLPSGHHNKLSRRGSRSSLTSQRQSFPSNSVLKSVPTQSSQKHGITLNLLQNSFRPPILSEELEKFTDFRNPQNGKEISIKKIQNQNQNQNIVLGVKNNFQLTSNPAISNLCSLQKKGNMNISLSPQSVSAQILSTQASRSNQQSPVLFHINEEKRAQSFFGLDLNLNDIINNNRQNIKNNESNVIFNNKMQKMITVETQDLIPCQTPRALSPACP